MDDRCKIGARLNVIECGDHEFCSDCLGKLTGLYLKWKEC